MVGGKKPPSRGQNSFNTKNWQLVNGCYNKQLNLSLSFLEKMNIVRWAARIPRPLNTTHRVDVFGVILKFHLFPFFCFFPIDPIEKMLETRVNEI
jgi:hypothetical protein